MKCAYEATVAFPNLHTIAVDLSHLGPVDHKTLLNQLAPLEPPIWALSQLFRSISRNNGIPLTEPKIRSLELTNVAPTLSLYKNFYRTEDFRTVMKGIKHLKLSINAWVVDPRWETFGCDFPYTYAPHEFMSFFPKAYLDNSSNLQELTLQFKEYAGLYPKLDLRGLSCPSLTVLKLCKVVVLPRRIFECILSLSRTLKTLYLVSCPLLVVLETTMALDRELYPVAGQSTNYGSTCPKYVTRCRYRDVFDRLREGLPKLTEFIVGELDEDTPDATPDSEQDNASIATTASSQPAYQRWISSAIPHIPFTGAFPIIILLAVWDVVTSSFKKNRPPPPATPSRPAHQRPPSPATSHIIFAVAFPITILLAFWDTVFCAFKNNCHPLPYSPPPLRPTVAETLQSRSFDWKISVGLRRERYKIYSKGHYEDPGGEFHNANLGGDAAALVRLWRHTGQRAEAEDVEAKYGLGAGYRDYWRGEEVDGLVWVV